MYDVWIITAVVVLYGLSNGLLLNVTPQVCLQLKFTSQQLGLVCAGIPIGYSFSCLACGRLLARHRSKHVLIGGVAVQVISLIAMANARSAEAGVVAQIGCGLAAGAFWPFASAWLMDFQSLTISRARLLRHYNVAWTTGTAVGMFSSGILCERGWIFETLYLAIGIAGLALIFAFIPRSTPAHHETVVLGAPTTPAPRLALSLLVAAVSVNLVALGARSTLWSNYAELNNYYHSGPERMGLITALSLAGQVLAFGFGALYEPWLGLRRIYVFIAAALIASNLTIAYSQDLPVLMGAALLLGATMALTFQTAMLAALRYFSTLRGGTTFHEAVVGIGTMMPILSGVIVANLKERGFEQIVALRSPFIFLAGLTGVLLLLQLSLLGRSTTRTLHHAPVMATTNSDG